MFSCLTVKKHQCPKVSKQVNIFTAIICKTIVKLESNCISLKALKDRVQGPGVSEGMSDTGINHFNQLTNCNHSP